MRGTPTPMDIEWAKDGRTGELFIVQARPETVHSRAAVQQLEQYRLRERGRVLRDRPQRRRRRSRPAPVRVIPNAADLRAVPGRARCWSPTRPIPTGSRS